jgi:NAD(P)-dependent dehydrogenase (short-subunit alcohol dehydrogenase family)
MLQLANAIQQFATRLVRTLRAVKKCYRHGGVTQVAVAQIHHGEILRGKNVLVTGGSSGIGLAIAKKCLTEGATVVITGRNALKLAAVALQLADSRLRTLQWDVSDTAHLAEHLRAAFALVDGRLDILVNNAGVHTPEQFFEVDEAAWDRVHTINTKALFFLSQHTAKWWIENRQPGKILNIASSGGFLGACGPYRMSKWSVVGLTRGLGASLLPHGIIVNAVAPGMTATEMLGIDAQDNAFAAGYGPSYRVALPEEIAELAVFLMSDAANYIVGQTIICDGGYSLKV